MRTWCAPQPKTPMARKANQARAARGPDPAGSGERRHPEGRDQPGIELLRGRAVPSGEPAGHDRVERPAERGAERERPPPSGPSPDQGRVTTRTPRKPTSIAAQRRGPTSRRGAGSTACRSRAGSEKKIAEVMVSGRKPSAAKFRTVLPSRKRAAQHDRARIAGAHEPLARRQREGHHEQEVHRGSARRRPPPSARRRAPATWRRCRCRLKPESASSISAMPRSCGPRSAPAGGGFCMASLPGRGRCAADRSTDRRGLSRPAAGRRGVSLLFLQF